ncbi:MAG TPA: hypothetical protein VKY26_11525 [Actinomycetota bacterium]|nr:hypothetical protein [Actinomycetota bacterium]
MQGYEHHNRGGGWSRRIDDHVILVGLVGPGWTGEWGYTVWLHGLCLAGAASPSWDPAEAARMAEIRLAELATRPAPQEAPPC